jgi:hypothetical protein
VLAQCSTLNDATWALWAKVLANSNPGVRGILAYELSAPAADTAARLARAFIKHAHDDKLPILDAWHAANAKDSEPRSWAAIVHKNAVKDTFADWRNLPALGDVSTDATVSNYLGFITDPQHKRAMPVGQPILIKPEPFQLKLEHVTATGTDEILPATLDGDAATFETGRRYRVTVTAPAPISSVTITWIHIRPNFSPQVDGRNCFDVGAMTTGSSHVWSDGAPNSLTITPAAPASSVFVELVTKRLESILELKPPHRPVFQAHHSYLWPRCQIVTQGSTVTFEFRTKGLIYFGPPQP